MNYELREEIARAIAPPLLWGCPPDGSINDVLKKRYLESADAILPIIARVREEAYARGINDAYSEGLPKP